MCALVLTHCRGDASGADDKQRFCVSGVSCSFDFDDNYFGKTVESQVRGTISPNDAKKNGNHQLAIIYSYSAISVVDDDNNNNKRD